jgi:hypothetical protein
MSGGGGLAVELISMAGNGALRRSSPAVRRRPTQWTLPVHPTKATLCDGPRLYSRLQTSTLWRLAEIRREGPRAMTVAAPRGGPRPPCPARRPLFGRSVVARMADLARDGWWSPV